MGRVADYLGGPMFPFLAFVLVAGICLGVAKRVTRSRYRRFWPGRVMGVTGRKGGGKSLFSVWQAYRQLRWPILVASGPGEGRRAYGNVASNFTMDVSRIVRKSARGLGPAPAPFVHPVSSWSDLLDLPPRTLVIIDEAALWCPLQPGKQLPLEVALLLKQARRLDIEILWLDQDDANVAAGLRRQTDFMADVRNMGSYHQVEVFDGRKFAKVGAVAEWRMRFSRSELLLGLYDTLEWIGAAGEVSEAPQLRALIERRLGAPPSLVEGGARSHLTAQRARYRSRNVARDTAPATASLASDDANS